jgi:hypothetical protein
MCRYDNGIESVIFAFPRPAFDRPIKSYLLGFRSCRIILDANDEASAMPNQINVIAPYWLDTVETWVFDDDRVGLVREPFVSGADTFLSEFVKDIPNARSGFRLLFSIAPFPAYQQKLIWVREEMGGNWYRSAEMQIEGWLCPALFRYFDRVPAQLYVRAEPLKS